MKTQHSSAIDELMREPSNWQLFTRRELAELLTAQVGYSVSEEQVRAALRQKNALDFTKQTLQVVPKAQTKVAITGKRQSFTKENPNTERVLIIGDLHLPFTLEEYLEFCISVRDHYKITHTIFIGDILDNHFSSYHETDPDGLSARDEFELAVERLKPWIDAFPVADVCIGNHDRLIARKAFSSGLSSIWLREFQDVLGCPQWDFKERFEYDGVQYIHGEGGTARTKSRNDLQSSVQGHLHNQAYVDYTVGNNFKIFGMQVGCGVDRKSYAMAYGRHFKKPVISCGVVLNYGQLPIVIPLEL